jgi:hypothetical protein
MLLVKKEGPAAGPDESPPPMPFIVGSGRCGTTLLRMMLDAHPTLAIPPETHFIPTLASVFSDPSKDLDEFLHALSGFHTWSDFGLEVGALDDALRSAGPFDLTHALRTFYRLYAEKCEKTRWGDKTPMYFASMGLVQRVLPEARFIHVIRDGRDVALSIKDLWFGPDSIQDIAGWWVSRIGEARSQVDELTWYLEIRYEDLVLNPERVLRDVCAFVDIPWDPVMLDYHLRAEGRLDEIRHDAPTHDRSAVIPAEQRVGIFSLVTEPPRADRTQRWRAEMSLAARAQFEGTAGALLEELGYEVG